MTAARKHKQQTLAEIGQSAYSSVVKLVAALRVAQDESDDGSQTPDVPNREQAELAIHEDALSVEVRSGWYTLESDSDRSPAEYLILLATGGPAVRIVGELRQGEPSSARLETQDWGTPWTEYRGVEVTRGKRKGELDDCPDEEVLLDYARCFYFGEG